MKPMPNLETVLKWAEQLLPDDVTVVARGVDLNDAVFGARIVKALVREIFELHGEPAPMGISTSAVRSFEEIVEAIVMADRESVGPVV